MGKPLNKICLTTKAKFDSKEIEKILKMTFFSNEQIKKKHI